MSKDNIVKFPGVKQNKHLTMKNELEAKMTDIDTCVILNRVFEDQLAKGIENL